ncbi:uncharacterized protein BKA78DRAFT_110930 [Phyllosticta capitalensis]|uniref:uncharacterized protein n=1 Tax=Phyllosticta capitalensis TaxID=121624 RepID=UPI00312D229E
MNPSIHIIDVFALMHILTTFLFLDTTSLLETVHRSLLTTICFLIPSADRTEWNWKRLGKRETRPSAQVLGYSGDWTETNENNDRTGNSAGKAEQTEMSRRRVVYIPRTSHQDVNITRRKVSQSRLFGFPNLATLCRRGMMGQVNVVYTFFALMLPLWG